ncbi:hypothetical protein [Muricoccus pecuniae]|uniref:Uncharacterized protein n=1 Tax=Muricoccus pecuniae TaxID=693023 RepID=A0A840YK71_9PROT|nr:hypothetical protein [Roseomonas pecuniae]MBB5694534.1 hypothetical protein [Roseomonas pecuniae]
MTVVSWIFEEAGHGRCHGCAALQHGSYTERNERLSSTILQCTITITLCEELSVKGEYAVKTDA